MRVDKLIQLGKNVLLFGTVLLCIVLNAPDPSYAQKLGSDTFVEPSVFKSDAPDEQKAGSDIVVESIIFDPTNPEPGESVVITATITNIGDEAGAIGWVYFYVDPPDNPPTDATPFTDRHGFGNLPLLPGKTFEMTTVGEVFEEEGVYPVWIRADAENEMDETDETNNLTGPIDLVVGDPPEATIDTDSCGAPYSLVADEPPSSHALVATDDIDFFSVDLVEGVIYRVSALIDDPDGPGDLELEISVSDPECGLDNFGISARMEFEAPLTDTYVLVVKSDNGVYGPDVSYKIQVEVLDDTGTVPSDPGDICEEAQTIIVNDRFKPQTLPLNDEDWYAFAVKADTKYDLKLFVDDTTVELPIIDLDTSCKPNSSAYEGLRGRVTTIIGADDTRYYARIFAPGRDVGGYSFTVDSVGPPPPAPDADGDGIPDEFEINGWDYDYDGQIDVNLPAMGADPNHKDIFIEIDYMVSDTFSYQPDPISIATIVESFDNAPVENPDGTTGIHLHVDYGANAPLTWGIASNWGELSASNSLPYSDYIGSCTPFFNWTDFDAFKNVHFRKGRNSVFHYNIWGHYTCPTSHGMIGLSRNNDESIETFRAGASDFMIALGSLIEGGPETLPVKDIGGVFMHELGHNLGLMHGGTNHKEYKPNYLSVMNHFFTTSGLNVNGEWENYDYSRTDNMPLDEERLDEPIGLNLDQSNVTATLFYCDGLVYGFPTYAIEWNCDGDTADADVQMDINGDGRKEILTTQNDWENLSYTGGAIGNFPPAGAFDEQIPLPSQTNPNEMNICVVQNGLPQNGVDGRNILVNCPPDPLNNAPVFDSETITVNATATLYISRTISGITDDDNDRLIYRGADLPPGIRVHAGKGEIYGVPEQGGTFISTITVWDGRGGEASQIITWEVDPPGWPLVVSMLNQTTPTQIGAILIFVALIPLLSVTLWTRHIRKTN